MFRRGNYCSGKLLFFWTVVFLSEHLHYLNIFTSFLSIKSLTYMYILIYLYNPFIIIIIIYLLFIYLFIFIFISVFFYGNGDINDWATTTIILLFIYIILFIYICYYSLKGYGVLGCRPSHHDFRPIIMKIKWRRGGVVREWWKTWYKLDIYSFPGDGTTSYPI